MNLKNDYELKISIATQHGITEEQLFAIQEWLEDKLRSLGTAIPDSAGLFSVGE